MGVDSCRLYLCSCMVWSPHSPKMPITIITMVRRLSLLIDEPLRPVTQAHTNHKSYSLSVNTIVSYGSRHTHLPLSQMKQHRNDHWLHHIVYTFPSVATYTIVKQTTTILTACNILQTSGLEQDIHWYFPKHLILAIHGIMHNVQSMRICSMRSQTDADVRSLVQILQVKRCMQSFIIGLYELALVGITVTVFSFFYSSACTAKIGLNIKRIKCVTCVRLNWVTLCKGWYQYRQVTSE